MSALRFRAAIALLNFAVVFMSATAVTPTRIGTPVSPKDAKLRKSSELPRWLPIRTAPFFWARIFFSSAESSSE